MKPIRPLIVFGTRPEAIKLAPVVRECRRRAADVEAIICTTGQHREMLQQITSYFEIEPDCHLDTMLRGQTLADLTARCIEAVDKTLADARCDCAVVQGDTTTVLATAVAAFYRRVPLVHVEAGLRTGDLQAPWPEEFNRRVTTIVTRLHCAPTQRAAENLLAEGVPPERVHVTGNTVIDALLVTRDRERRRDDQWRKKYHFLADGELVLVTGHRRESFGTGFERICRAIDQLAARFPDVTFLYPVHLNPDVQEPVYRILGKRDNIYLTPPASYPEFIWLMDRSKLILTDSGGVQEEAPSLAKPVLVMRETTERPEGVDAGAVELVGTSVERIVDAATLLLTDEAEYRRRQIEKNPYGDGHAAERIVSLLLEHVGS